MAQTFLNHQSFKPYFFLTVLYQSKKLRTDALLCRPKYSRAISSAFSSVFLLRLMFFTLVCRYVVKSVLQDSGFQSLGQMPRSWPVLIIPSFSSFATRNTKMQIKDIHFVKYKRAIALCSTSIALKNLPYLQLTTRN